MRARTSYRNRGRKAEVTDWYHYVMLMLLHVYYLHHERKLFSGFSLRSTVLTKPAGDTLLRSLRVLLWCIRFCGEYSKASTLNSGTKSLQDSLADGGARENARSYDFVRVQNLSMLRKPCFARQRATCESPVCPVSVSAFLEHWILSCLALRDNFIAHARYSHSLTIM